jgi:OmpA-OmpF porin, OOP family
MATFDVLTDELAAGYGLGAGAGPLVKEVLRTISGSSGGLAGFLDMFKRAGLSSEVASWLGRAEVVALAGGQVERALGAAELSGIGGRLGLAQDVLAPALGYAVPRIVGLLTPGGVVPAGVPATVTAMLAQPAQRATPQRPGASPAAAAAQNQPGVGRWLWPTLGALVVAGYLGYFWVNRSPSVSHVANAPAPAAHAPSTVAQVPGTPPAPEPAEQPPAPPPPAAHAPAPAPTDAQASPPPPPALAATASAPTAAPAPAIAAPAAVAAAEPAAPPSGAGPARLALSSNDGLVRASGVVRNDNARASVLDALNGIFGADKVKSDISVDDSAAAAPWLGALRPAFETLKGANVDAIFDGDKVNVGGAALGDDARDKIVAALKSALGADVAVGTLTDKSAAAISIANDKATSELASLQPGFTARDVLFALNDSVVNFPSSSAEVPESMAPFLKNAAAELKQLKTGHVLEIAGYTDDTGEAAMNLALSQKRAEAVREALIRDGVDPDMLVAKGYGEADPIASNDTAEGRLKNRRIEYHVVKTPT